MIEFTIPGSPVPKGRPKLTTIGGMARAYTPAKTRNYESLVRLAAEQAMSGAAPLDGALCVELVVHLPVPESWSQKKRQAALSGAVVPSKKPDLDNVVKAVLDGMNSVAFVDDARIVDLVARKRYSETPKVAVFLSEAAGTAA